MLKNITRPERRRVVEFAIEFEYEEDGGFSFPCDGQGNVGELPPEAQKNYEYCLAHPEEFEVWNVMNSYYREWMEPGSGDCICGNRVELRNQYQGACECEKCGRWYNLFGQELLPPEYWESEYDEHYEDDADYFGYA